VAVVATGAEQRTGLARRVGGFLHRSVIYLREVRAEVERVSWPTPDDLRRTTLVIIVFVIVIGLIIGLMDMISQWLLINLLGRALR
jgi:preprotein translocase subunit SecE